MAVKRSIKRVLNGLVERAKKDRRILAVILFGSVARRQARQDSDTDICLVLEEGSYTPLQLSRVKLEYARDLDQDIQIFQQLPLYIRKRVLAEGVILYSADSDRLYEAAFAFIRDYAHYEHIYRDYLEEVARAG